MAARMSDINRRNRLAAERRAAAERPKPTNPRTGRTTGTAKPGGRAAQISARNRKLADARSPVGPKQPSATGMGERMRRNVSAQKRRAGTSPLDVAVKKEAAAKPAKAATTPRKKATRAKPSKAAAAPAAPAKKAAKKKPWWKSRGGVTKADMVKRRKARAKARSARAFKK